MRVMKITIRKNHLSDLMDYGINGRRLNDQIFFLIGTVYLFALNFSLRKYSAVWYAVAAVCILYYFIVIVKKNKVLKLDFYCIWLLLFFSYTVLSYLWCISVPRVNMITRTLVLMMIINILVENLIRTKADLETLLFVFYIILFVTAVMILVSVDFSKLGVMRIGADMEKLNIWNANRIGKLNAILAIFSLHYLLEQKKRLNNAFYLVGFILGLFLCFNSGSRKSLLDVFLFIILFFGFRGNGRKRIAYFFIGMILLFGLYMMVMNYESVYNVLGYRIEQMIRGILLHEKQEASYSIRQNMIELGIKWWMNKPILGYGFGCYSALYYQAVGVDTYSHCNFIEILVSGGIVGFVLYYGIYAIIFSLYKKTKNRCNASQKTLFYIVLIELALNAANVIYYDWMNHLLLMLSYISLKYCTLDNLEENV